MQKISDFMTRNVQVVRPESQGDLRNLRRHHHPIGFDVWNVVQHQARDGDALQIHETGGLRNMRQRRILGMKGQRDIRLEAARLIL